MNWSKAMSLVCAAALSLVLAAQSQTERSPAAPTSDSPWNVLAFGGKGEMHGAPICHPLEFFSSSPKALDFDGTFVNEQPSDLTSEANVTFVGTMSGRKIYELLLTVDDAFTRSSNQRQLPFLEALLVQRGPNQYCDIFENVYTYDPTDEINETTIVHAAGHDFLKTYQTDLRTWILEYWEMAREGPRRLDLEGFYESIRSQLPEGGALKGDLVDLTHPDLQFRVEDLHGTTLGTLDLHVAVKGAELVIVKRVWTPQ